MQNLPLNIQEYLANPDFNISPELSHSDVLSKLMKANKPNRVVQGDLPKKLAQRFICELTITITITSII